MPIQNKKSKSSIFNGLFTIPHENGSLNGETWFTIQPCKTYIFFGKPVVITQPSSSFWVYLLGLLTTGLGIYFLRSKGMEISRALWGWSLILWGIGAILAGTSYQAFGYQIKCVGREKVAWTSWWEVTYLIFQQLSINVMFVGVVYSCLPRFKKVAIILSLLVSFLYMAMILYGAFKPVKSLITYELMVKICTPFIFFFLTLNGWRWFEYRLPLDRALLGVWVGLILIDRLYWWYFKADFSGKLWAKKRWFSENDVLHVTLIFWIAYIALVVEPLVNDLQ